mmetsp:Transcript_21960/g.21098  ORF Transcript_21960/g.21098 Transcript_21960/m.21098 type:complete len:215 (+) Transcript_21960:201-845(+)
MIMEMTMTTTTKTHRMEFQQAMILAMMTMRRMVILKIRDHPTKRICWNSKLMMVMKVATMNWKSWTTVLKKPRVNGKNQPLSNVAPMAKPFQNQPATQHPPITRTTIILTIIVIIMWTVRRVVNRQHCGCIQMICPVMMKMQMVHKIALDAFHFIGTMSMITLGTMPMERKSSSNRSRTAPMVVTYWIKSFKIKKIEKTKSLLCMTHSMPRTLN